MKKILFFSLFLFVAFQGISQEAYKAENEGWLVKMDEAYALSKKTGKPIMANFSVKD